MRVFLIALFLLVSLLFGSIFGFVKYKSYSVDSFCNNVAETDKPEEIVSRARALGLFPVEWEGANDIWVFNQEGPPMFRFACKVKFVNGKVSKKEVIDAD